MITGIFIMGFVILYSLSWTFHKICTFTRFTSINHNILISFSLFKHQILLNSFIHLYIISEWNWSCANTVNDHRKYFFIIFVIVLWFCTLCRGYFLRFSYLQSLPQLTTTFWFYFFFPTSDYKSFCQFYINAD